VEGDRSKEDRFDVVFGVSGGCLRHEDGITAQYVLFGLGLHLKWTRIGLIHLVFDIESVGTQLYVAVCLFCAIVFEICTQ